MLCTWKWKFIPIYTCKLKKQDTFKESLCGPSTTMQHDTMVPYSYKLVILITYEDSMRLCGSYIEYIITILQNT